MRDASRGPFVFASRRCLNFSSSAQDLLRLAYALPSLEIIRIVGGAVQGAAWQRSPLDPHRDLAPSKVIDSCPVASFDLLRSKVAAFIATRLGTCVLPYAWADAALEL